MGTVYFNDRYMYEEDVRISPEDRGFLFADGIYEVVRWYGKDFLDMDAHLARLKRSLGEVGIIWKDVDYFPTIAEDLIKIHAIRNKPSIVYIEVTRGAAKRSHFFPVPAVPPTVYVNAWDFTVDEDSWENGIRVMLREDIRWSRCDIKSIALLPNTMSFNDAYTSGYKECAFVRNGYITECSHSNIFFVKNDILYTHPESNFILSGVTRKNVLSLARSNNIRVIEEGVSSSEEFNEVFITNTSSEILPVTELGGKIIGHGLPGDLTRFLQEKFRSAHPFLKQSSC
jgi:D-alanine transaminase